MRVISVGYGHNPSGKLYDYETEKQYRTGDVVVVPVTHSQSKKKYNTLATVMMTYNGDTSAGMEKLDYLTDPKNKINTKNTNERLGIAKEQGLNVEDDRQVGIWTLPGYNTMRTAVERGDSRITPTNWSGSTRLISRTNRSA